jgi:hypothetical protein
MSDEPLAADLLIGARKIAAFIGITERQAFHQIEAGNIPTTRMGRLIVASKSGLRRHFTEELKVAS